MIVEGEMNVGPAILLGLGCHGYQKVGRKSLIFKKKLNDCSITDYLSKPLMIFLVKLPLNLLKHNLMKQNFFLEKPEKIC